MTRIKSSLLPSLSSTSLASIESQMGYIPGVVERQLQQLLTLLVRATAIPVTVTVAVHFDVTPTLFGSLSSVCLSLFVPEGSSEEMPLMSHSRLFCIDRGTILQT
jgi:hypothetical protein